MTISDFIREWESGKPYIAAHTSGSTGKPKRILLPRALVEASARRSIEHFGIDSGSRVHVCLSADYIAGKMAIVRALISGALLTREEPSSAPLSGEDASSPEITLLSVVGTQVAAMAERATDGTLPSIKHLLIGGAPLTQDVAAMAHGVAREVWESYGMTETASHVALRRIESPEDVLTRPFRLLPGIEGKLDERGCLVLTMPHSEPLITNDVCRFTGEGEFFVLGRADNVIITGGLKVHPEHVESVLRPLLPSGQSFFIAGVPDAKWGSRVVLVVEGEGVESARQKQLLSKCAALLPPHERPREVICVKEFARTASGKIIRKL